MATGINTGGYARASVMPDAGLVDPRLLAADYSGLTQGIGKGLQLVGNYNNQRQLALDRVDANSLRELRLAAQRGQLELEPQLQQNNLALSNRAALEARTKLIDLESTRSVTPRNRYGAPTNTFTPDNSPEAIASGILGTYTSTPNKLGQDVVVQDDRLVYDPQINGTRNIRSVASVLNTAENIANTEADNARLAKQAEAQAAAAAAELARKEAAAKEVTRLAEDTIKIKRDAEDRMSKAPSGFVTPGGQFDRRSAQNAADVNRYLLFSGGLNDVNNFSNTPNGRSVVLKIQKALTTQNEPNFTDADYAAIEGFRGVAPAVEAEGALPVIPISSPQSQATQSRDQEALDWASANPDDPRSAVIRQRLGL